MGLSLQILFLISLKIIFLNHKIRKSIGIIKIILKIHHLILRRTLEIMREIISRINSILNPIIHLLQTEVEIEIMI